MAPWPVVVPLVLSPVAPLNLPTSLYTQASSRAFLRTVVKTTGREVARGLNAVAWPQGLASHEDKSSSRALLRTVIKTTGREVAREPWAVLGQGAFGLGFAPLAWHLPLQPLTKA
uniref:Uncharacterized protein n=1 Tax=Solanum tuberosum TaxID=4113 RepID=M1DI69_SOLTU